MAVEPPAARLLAQELELEMEIEHRCKTGGQALEGRGNGEEAPEVGERHTSLGALITVTVPLPGSNKKNQYTELFLVDALNVSFNRLRRELETLSINSYNRILPFMRFFVTMCNCINWLLQCHFSPEAAVHFSSLHESFEHPNTGVCVLFSGWGQVLARESASELEVAKRRRVARKSIEKAYGLLRRCLDAAIADDDALGQAEAAARVLDNLSLDDLTASRIGSLTSGVPATSSSVSPTSPMQAFLNKFELGPPFGFDELFTEIPKHLPSKPLSQPPCPLLSPPPALEIELLRFEVPGTEVISVPYALTVRELRDLLVNCYGVERGVELVGAERGARRIYREKKPGWVSHFRYTTLDPSLELTSIQSTAIIARTRHGGPFAELDLQRAQRVVAARSQAAQVVREQMVREEARRTEQERKAKLEAEEEAERQCSDRRDALQSLHYGMLLRRATPVRMTRMLFELRTWYRADAFQEKYRALRRNTRGNEDVVLFALTVQKMVLPKYGFSGDIEGVENMRREVGFISFTLHDRVVEKLMIDIHQGLEVLKPGEITTLSADGSSQVERDIMNIYNQGFALTNLEKLVAANVVAAQSDTSHRGRSGSCMTTAVGLAIDVLLACQCARGARAWLAASGIAALGTVARELYAATVASRRRLVLGVVHRATGYPAASAAVALATSIKLDSDPEVAAQRLALLMLDVEVPRCLEAQVYVDTYELASRWHAGERDLEACEKEGGASLLHFASGDGNVELVRSLLAVGVRVDPRDHRGRTPAYWAATHGHGATFALLSASGADIDMADAYHRTPRQIMCEGQT